MSFGLAVFQFKPFQMHSSLTIGDHSRISEKAFAGKVHFSLPSFMGPCTVWIWFR